MFAVYISLELEKKRKKRHVFPFKAFHSPSCRFNKKKWHFPAIQGRIPLVIAIQNVQKKKTSSLMYPRFECYHYIHFFFLTLYTSTKKKWSKYTVWSAFSIQQNVWPLPRFISRINNRFERRRGCFTCWKYQKPESYHLYICLPILGIVAGIFTLLVAF